ncbi:MAG: AMP nucleosidase [Alphaproteobacteria bacterium]|nr:AMP nucleosidase [Alphaproteobacteria bacterium]
MNTPTSTPDSSNPQGPLEGNIPATALVRCASGAEAVARLTQLYDAALAAIEEDFEAFAAGDRRNARQPVYPYLGMEVEAVSMPGATTLAFGKVTRPGWYGNTITAPRLFARYLTEQIELVQSTTDAAIYVGESRTPIPLTFAVERAASRMSAKERVELARHFPMPRLDAAHDAIADGGRWTGPGAGPLSLFSAERVDYSLHRLRHYTGTDPAHFQSFVLFTNYQRYIDEFVDYAHTEIDAGRARQFIEPGGRVIEKGKPPSRDPLVKMPQMPAYHLVQENGEGITLVNIGVGPSNAKTITDHIAVLRPHVWLMVGHCGGLRGSQRLGDYVLANAYLRDDHVLDQLLPLAIPVPTIAEVQLALADAVKEVTGASGKVLKERLRTGTVVTTDDRNWELRFEELSVRFNQSRAIAIDMESATLAANGYRFRVPYGTLLCVSDRPLHGEIKLPGMADAFYEERVSQHLQIGIKALELMRTAARNGTLHSRKLRSFTEPAFR